MDRAHAAITLLGYWRGNIRNETSGSTKHPDYDADDRQPQPASNDQTSSE
jgi:hypothetical protein